MAGTASSASAGHDFPDVPDDHTFHDEISWMVDEGITTGYPDDTFRPAVTTTRQAAVAFLYRLAGEPAGDYSNDFSDVPEGHTFHDEISWAYEQGITTGYDDGTFRPGDRVARQASAAFLYRYAGEPAGVYDNDFSDVPSGHTFHDEISWMAENGVTRGYPDDTFRPVIGSARQAWAAFLFRFADLGVITGTVADVSDAQAGEVDDGDPIEGAEVDVALNGTTIRTALTEADGTYRVHVPAGSYDLEATAAGYAQTYGWQANDVPVAEGGTTDVDFGLYPAASEPAEADTTTTSSTDDDVEERDDWWLVEAQDDQGDPLDVDDSTEIVYVNPDDEAVSLGNAGTGPVSWWAKPTDTRRYADGVHHLYYNVGTSQDEDWWQVSVEFFDGQLTAVNGQAYTSAGAATASSTSGGDSEPEEGAVVPN